MKKSPYYWQCGNTRNKGFFIYRQYARKAAVFKALRAFSIRELSLSYQDKESKDCADAKNVPANEGRKTFESGLAHRNFLYASI